MRRCLRKSERTLKFEVAVRGIVLWGEGQEARPGIEADHVVKGRVFLQGKQSAVRGVQ